MFKENKSGSIVANVVIEIFSCHASANSLRPSYFTQTNITQDTDLALIFYWLFSGKEEMGNTLILSRNPGLKGNIRTYVHLSLYGSV